MENWGSGSEEQQRGEQGGVVRNLILAELFWFIHSMPFLSYLLLLI